jgi:hypothetical protein
LFGIQYTKVDIADNEWYNFPIVMKKITVVILFLVIISLPAIAGLLSGQTSGFVDRGRTMIIGTDYSTTMFETPFSSFNIYGKYGITDDLNVFAKIGAGNVDYSSSSSYESTTSPTVYSGGFEYKLFKAPGSTEYYNLILEYESAGWRVNDVSNNATCATLGIELVKKANDAQKYNFRLVVSLFDAGKKAGDRILSGTKYGFSTRNEYLFAQSILGCIEGGVLAGDERGLLVFFSAGIGYAFTI